MLSKVRDERSKGQGPNHATERLPVIKPQVPRRKFAVVKEPSISNSTDLPHINKGNHTEEQRFRIKEGRWSSVSRLDISTRKSPLLHRPLSSKSQELDTKSNISARRRHLSLQPISTQLQHSGLKSPLSERRISSINERATEKRRSNNISVSLEDVMLYHENDPDDMGHFLSCWHDDGTCPWSKHWCFTRRSIGSRPDKDTLNEFEKLNAAFGESLKVGDYQTSGHELELYGALEPDIMSERTISSTKLSLEERLASIERQQGLSHVS